ncbi:MAG: hypothetical protein A2149_00465 [Candidatus Schekmanbacteria bacterium RBG_16_38_11]|uniref:Uncharacterized protein n=2 Tax=Candidatus Schekmaniibacteriota TaxID=1817811 RepID=A0A1F7RP71_9BACT|nr:MAG: hypothetical protein A2042_09595 [Candidatus Schekmanbacteria bacterium GWA2_38_11]OGL44261.1 MAG: hypothetical protein A2149_00465 [Candidatus Schekmanbacteria bacterium RBG_16_38_11]
MCFTSPYVERSLSIQCFKFLGRQDNKFSAYPFKLKAFSQLSSLWATLVIAFAMPNWSDSGSAPKAMRIFSFSN